MHAYQRLEALGMIHTKPRSGYFVSANYRKTLPEPPTSHPPRRSVAVDIGDVVFEVLAAVRDRSVIGLGSAFPSATLFPLRKLGSYLAAATRRVEPSGLVEGLAPGHIELRRQIARRYLETDVHLGPDELVITDGALEALHLCLHSVTEPGDRVAIECPTFYAALEAVQACGLRGVEIATTPGEGMDLGALQNALKTQSIKAVWLMTNFQNPLGALMPEDKKKALVALLARHEVPLIEDDAYGELYQGNERPKPAKAFDRNGLVLHCGSFSKCLAPWYRVGWAAPGRFHEQVKRRKLMATIATNSFAQIAIADYLKQGGYDMHLRRLRRLLQGFQESMRAAVSLHFPLGTRMTQPRGGYFLWLQLPAKIDALELHRRALEKGVSVAPGRIFSPRDSFNDCIRLNYGLGWNRDIEAAVAAVGELTRALVSAARDARVGEREAVHDVAD
jgi:DNA-binding transcriptional MocR family regulator